MNQDWSSIDQTTLAYAIRTLKDIFESLEEYFTMAPQILYNFSAKAIEILRSIMNVHIGNPEDIEASAGAVF